jgi:hypothetical protein
MPSIDLTNYKWKFVLVPSRYRVSPVSGGPGTKVQVGPDFLRGRQVPNPPPVGSSRDFGPCQSPACCFNISLMTARRGGGIDFGSLKITFTVLGSFSLKSGGEAFYTNHVK